MYKYLNIFFKTNFYDNLPRFFSRKLFKIFKIFFVETSLKELPKNNHPSEVYYDEQLEKINKSKDENFSPFISYPNILNTLNTYNNFKKNINFYDFGANNLDLYLFLNKNFKNLTYYYYDQPHYNQVIESIKNHSKFQNLIVDNELKVNCNDLDFVYFGSAIQYIDNYEEIITTFIKKKPKYIIIAQTPFFLLKNSQENIIAKQLNLHPTINFLYIFNYILFNDFMKKEKYVLTSNNINRTIKFINFKNFSKKFEKIDMFDLVFKYDEKL